MDALGRSNEALIAEGLIAEPLRVGMDWALAMSLSETWVLLSDSTTRCSVTP